MSANETRGWTPGKWTHGKAFAGEVFNADQVFSETGIGIACVYAIPTNHTLAAAENWAEKSDDCARGLANARLIAAAPELAEALEAALKMCESYESLELEPSDNGVHPVCAAARAALAKARGSK